MSYTESHDPSYAKLIRDLGPVWTVAWVWPEKEYRPGRPCTVSCGHRHRSLTRAFDCALTRVDEVRDPPV